MSDDIDITGINPQAEVLVDTLRDTLNPLVRLFLKRGISWGEFEEIAKLAFVGQAAEHFQLPNRKMTDSRISVITGLTRRDVKRLRELNEQGEHSTKTYNANRATRVLSGWYQDQTFITADGEAMNLPIESESPASFTELCRRYAGDVPVMALVAELKRVGSITENPDGTLQIINRSYTPNNDNAEQLAVIARAIADLAVTVEHNTAVDDSSDAWFQRSAFTTDLSDDDTQALQALLQDQGQAFLETIDDWMTKRAASNKQKKTNPQADATSKRSGVGLYYFERD